jgi:ferredoxin
MAGMRHTGEEPAQRRGEGPAMADKATLKVHVNQDKCQGHNRCKAIAPELFALDEYGNAHEIGDGSVPPELEEKAYLAKSNCPEFAVEIVEK